ncbi:hypothetical protein FB45DRAFT_924641 [Roridomyces roridus]|uniref:Uncharacterized protein n=1 Tax=Roridomyces roridus TaxID=1738132 RepID=A0AAD7BMN7_9AGAR|nr:hypothetical protein FB45DRAFT_924641 [Roridomyces roridus]
MPAFFPFSKRTVLLMCVFPGLRVKLTSPFSARVFPVFLSLCDPLDEVFRPAAIFLFNLAYIGFLIASLATRHPRPEWWRYTLLACFVFFAASTGFSTWRAWKQYKEERDGYASGPAC